MRVAIVSESFLPNVNGVVNSVLRVAEHFDHTGHEAIIVAPDTPWSMRRTARETSGPSRVTGADVHYIPSVMVPKVSSLPVGVPAPSMFRVLADFQPDIVHLASPFVVGAAGAAAARRLDVPAVGVFQTDVAGFAASYGMKLGTRAAWAWTRKLHSACDRTLAPSTVSVKALRDQGIPRVFQWGRGVDAERFNPGRRDEELRAQWSPDGKLIVGFVGRLAPEKHVERLAILSGRSDVQLVIVGGGPERARLQQMMPDAVFTGELRGLDLARAYASLDVFVHAGEHETFCQAVQEAMASGVPAIGPDAGGPRDLIGHFRTGYLLPVEGFSERLVDAVGTLQDAGVRADFGSAARRWVQGRTWSAISDQLLGHYDAVLGRDLVARRSA
ncbi:glycosyltransferase family 1 protein [Williamsia sp. 1135]|uniref:glycosyltransferase family 4 protein n=1 Tax=Williamsia sp. 1135 TaxID=1889262 RepID=UPI000A0F4BFA|nr:glycosyltransferase family 1 protein [Williamsia sp. 1135]ORM32256.1 alpha-mannosyltransferase [Williamsia sp. 1135]